MSRQERRRADEQVDRSFSQLNISRDDRLKLAENVWDVVDLLSQASNKREARHFESHWSGAGSTSPRETRKHVDDCPTCGLVTDLLLRDTTLEYEPLGDEHRRRSSVLDEVTVIAEGVRPKRELHLPNLPVAMRSMMRGKEIIVNARINPFGRATILNVSGSAASQRFAVERAKDMVRSTSWSTPRDASGQSTHKVVKIIFRWE